MKYLLLAVLLFTQSCAASIPSSLTTEQARRAYPALQIAIRINQLQAAAIQAEAMGGLDTKTTEIIVRFSVSANKTLAAIPDGWLIAVTKAWNEAKNQIQISNTTILAAMAVVDAGLGLLQQ